MFELTIGCSIRANVGKYSHEFMLVVSKNKKRII